MLSPKAHDSKSEYFVVFAFSSWSMLTVWSAIFPKTLRRCHISTIFMTSMSNRLKLLWWLHLPSLCGPARLVLVGQSIALVRHQPPSVFIDVDWTGFSPTSHDQSSALQALLAKQCTTDYHRHCYISTYYSLNPRLRLETSPPRIPAI